jgi:prephenate dehydratase/prephenate dehydrogenase
MGVSDFVAFALLVCGVAVKTVTSFNVHPNCLVSTRIVPFQTKVQAIGGSGRSTEISAAASGASPVAPYPMKVAFQGEPGAYSEKAARELLGPRIAPVGYESFEDAFKAVASRDVDYACVPIENSLGGSIHTNFDLLMRYDLHIVAEHEFRVEHALLALPGVKVEDITRVMSHPQALAQCDDFLRSKGLKPVPEYDTAGSAKMIADGNLRDCAAVASDLAGSTYGLDVLEANIEDHDNNFTRFLLLARQPVSSFIPPKSSAVKAKTSIVFVLPNTAGALYKALACFTLRDIDFCKIESRPTSTRVLQFLQYKEGETSQHDLPRFRYTFYLDFLAAEYDDDAQNALIHLREQSTFVRVLGSYPTGSKLVGPVKGAIDALNKGPAGSARRNYPYVSNNDDGAMTGGVSSSNSGDRLSEGARRQGGIETPLKIGIVGFGKFGQFLAKTFIKTHRVHGVSRADCSVVAKDIGCDFSPLFDMRTFVKADMDVVLISTSIISFEEVLRSLPNELVRGKLVVDVLSVKGHAKTTMLNELPPDCDILCTHPMFGPESGKYGWTGLPFLYDKIRITDESRCEKFLKIFERERCKMIEMTCEQHDEYAASSQFITHLTGRILWQQNLVPTPIDTKGFQTVLSLVDNTCSDSFDLFFGLYYYNDYAQTLLRDLREAMAKVERQLAAKEAYLTAQKENASADRAAMVQELRSLMEEVVQAKNDGKDG